MRHELELRFMTPEEAGFVRREDLDDYHGGEMQIWESPNGAIWKWPKREGAARIVKLVPKREERECQE